MVINRVFHVERNQWSVVFVLNVRDRSSLCSVGSLIALNHLNIETGSHFQVSCCPGVNWVHFKPWHVLLNRICVFLLTFNVALLLSLLISFLKICSINPHAPQSSCYWITTVSDICCFWMKSAVPLTFSLNVIFYCLPSQNLNENAKNLTLCCILVYFHYLNNKSLVIWGFNEV